MVAITINTAGGGTEPVTGRRWGYVGLGVVMFLFFGLLYAWSVFVPPLEREFGWTRAETSITFSMCMAFFCIGSLAAGVLSRKKPPRVAMIISALCMGLGFFLTARIDSLPGLYLCYGGLVGFGVGIGYCTLISTLVRWFPDRAGLVSGILLMGFGCGALVLGSLCGWLEAQVGWRSIFTGLSVIYAALFLGTSFLIAPPPASLRFPAAKPMRQSAVEQGLVLTTREMLSRPSFYIYFFWTSCMAATGFILVGHAVPMVSAYGIAPALAAVMAGVVSLSNGLGRVVGGIGFDTLGRKTVMRVSSGGCIFGGLLIFAALNTGSVPLFIGSFIFAGLCLGFSVVSAPVVIRSFYGMEHYTQNYSIMSLCGVVGSIAGPLVAGLLHTAMDSYAAVPFCMLGFGGVALLAAFALKKP